MNEFQSEAERIDWFTRHIFNPSRRPIVPDVPIEQQAEEWAAVDRALEPRWMRNPATLSWIVFEEIGFAVINDFAISRIQVSD